MQTIDYDAHLDQQLHTYHLGLEDAENVSDDESITEWNAVIGRYEGEEGWTHPAESDLAKLAEIAQQVIDGYTDLPEFVVDQFKDGLDEIEAWRKDPDAIPGLIDGQEW